ncbi:MAG: sulfite exporter TauE/SafE family protein [Candidatus Tectimicrobiota bacterium]
MLPLLRCPPPGPRAALGGTLACLRRLCQDGGRRQPGGTIASAVPVLQRWPGIVEDIPVLLTWIAGACTLGLASFVFGLTGFGIGLVALSLLPFLLPPATVVPLITLFGAAFASVMSYQLRRDIQWPHLTFLACGTLLGTPLGVWVLDACPPGLLKRLIGVVLMTVVLIEWYGVYPTHLSGPGWGLGAGLLAGLLGGAIATPGPPVILYAVAQGWPPRRMKAMLQAFFLINQSAILANQWWVGLLSQEVLWLAGLYVLPATLGVGLGIRLFDRIDHLHFRRVMFALLFVLGLLLSVRG